LKLLLVPNIETRMNSYLLKFTMRSQFDDLKAVIDAHTLGICGIKMSRTFLTLLRGTLVLGNYMNYGGRLGGAAGFRLNLLPKLQDVRCSDGSNSSLLEYLVKRIVKATGADSKSLREEIPQLASKEIKVPLQDVVASLNNIENALSDAKYDVDSPDSEEVKVEIIVNEQQQQPNAKVDDGDGSDAEGSSVAGEGDAPFVSLEIVADAYHSVMGSFIEEATVEKNDLLDSVTKTKEAFSQMVSYFGENAAALKSETEFWSIVSELAEAYHRIHKQTMKDMKAEEEKESWRLKREKAKSMAAVEDQAGARKAVKYKRTGYGTCPIHDEPEHYVPWDGQGGSEPQ